MLATPSSVPAQEQLVNGQTLSATIIDTDYSANVATTYYLVVGNTKGGIPVFTGQTFLNVTEVKR